MKGIAQFIFISLLPVSLVAQTAVRDPAAVVSIDFVSDTQQPMGIEKIYLKPTHNVQATAMIFGAVLRDKPAALFMLGDIVSLGYRNKKWSKVDRFLDSARHEGVKVYALLGNHDVMGRDRKGEFNFNKRFPERFRTGYLEVVDSIAILLLNSNFSKLSAQEQQQQQQWYTKTMDSLNNTLGVKAIIVTSHHPVFTNSNMVNPSPGLRQNFLPAFLAAKKGVIFITGHAHAFEHFRYEKKDFLVIGGGGGLHQPLSDKPAMPADVAKSYKPLFHYLNIKRYGNALQIVSYYLKEDFSGFVAGYSFSINL